MIPVYTYWQGPQPEWISICLKSIARHNAQTICHLPDLPREYEAKLNPRWRSLPLMCWKADCIRMALLSETGGWWIDADTVMIKPLSTIDVGDAPCAYFTWSRPPRRIPNGYVYMNAQFASRMLEKINAKLETWNGDRNQAWTWLGETLLTPLIDSTPGCMELPLSTFQPIEVDHEVVRYFDRGNPEDFIKPETVAFGLNNTWMMRVHAYNMGIPLPRMRNSGLLIHQLISRSAEGTI